METSEMTKMVNEIYSEVSKDVNISLFNVPYLFDDDGQNSVNELEKITGKKVFAVKMNDTELYSDDMKKEAANIINDVILSENMKGSDADLVSSYAILSTVISNFIYNNMTRLNKNRILVSNPGDEVIIPEVKLKTSSINVPKVDSMINLERVEFGEDYTMMNIFLMRILLKLIEKGNEYPYIDEDGKPTIEFDDESNLIKFNAESLYIEGISIFNSITFDSINYWVARNFIQARINLGNGDFDMDDVLTEMNDHVMKSNPYTSQLLFFI